ncbi:hypothetical protein [Streptomyces bacillaris]|uniref:hypothetical protein n=1 Tax=Streptomyces bacillaris TaxID=68179 RepID=UPI00382625A7
MILSASAALHGVAALLDGLPHLRFVHELVTTENRPLRWLGRLARQGEQQVAALYPTTAVRDQPAAALPHLRGQVGTFRVDDGRRLTAAEGDGGRSGHDHHRLAPPTSQNESGSRRRTAARVAAS